MDKGAENNIMNNVLLHSAVGARLVGSYASSESDSDFEEPSFSVKDHLASIKAMVAQPQVQNNNNENIKQVDYVVPEHQFMDTVMDLEQDYQPPLIEAQTWWSSIKSAYCGCFSSRWKKQQTKFNEVGTNETAEVSHDEHEDELVL
mmetsp:Transcript_15427/g.22690  ORF Transcript_15427/g.22690 Transcript_15427/m.22690 type:complete len:146 (-) Transcript_15427:71-508(-)